MSKRCVLCLCVGLFVVAGFLPFFGQDDDATKGEVAGGAGGSDTAAQPSELQKVLAASFEKGLRWLMARQLGDGSWPDPQGKGDVAFTAMAVIAIAGAPDELRKEFQGQMDKGVKYILGCVEDSGRIIDAGKVPTLANYKTGLGLRALVAADRNAYALQIAKARRYLEQTQFHEDYMGIKPDDKSYGGWGYDEKIQQPNADLSNTSMTLMALKEAGLPEDSPVWKRAIIFLERCQNRSESNQLTPKLREQGFVALNDGGFYYRVDESKAGTVDAPGGKKAFKSYGSMTYAGLLSFLYAFVTKDDPRVVSAYNWLRERFTLEENPGLRTDAEPQLGKQGLFYYYHTLAKALDAYGEAELVAPDGTRRAWADELVKHLAAIQQQDGSWKNIVSRWWEDDPGLCTSYVLMAMNIARRWVR